LDLHVHRAGLICSTSALLVHGPATELSPWRRDLCRHARWLRSLDWPTRLIVIIGEITVAYICVVFGMLVGVVIFT
jgi:hypothetical protein